MLCRNCVLISVTRDFHFAVCSNSFSSRIYIDWMRKANEMNETEPAGFHLFVCNNSYNNNK